MKMVGILTSKPCITVSSLKGNTLGILERLDPKHYTYCRISNTSNPVNYWHNSEVILLGTSTYYPSNTHYPAEPKQFKEYISHLNSLCGKQIILFGSGRSEYPLFCGAIDYLEKLLNAKNNIRLVYKFEGYPRDKQKFEFKRLVEEIINE